MKTNLQVTILLFTLIFSAVLCQAQSGGEYTDEEIAKVEKLFDEANQLMERKNFSEALIKYKEAMKIADDSPGILYNGGLAAFSIKDYATALEFWKKLKQIEPEDWQVRTKLVQTFQALGKLSERDDERKELFDLRKQGKIGELNNAEFYVREQTEMGGSKILVFEHFELKGNRALRYVFYILDDNGDPEYRISLGSYDTTNAIYQEMNKGKTEGRLFHLDGYYDWGHATYGMFPKEPTYDETREMVRKILEKEKKPISGTVVNPQPKDQEEEKPY